MPDITAEARRAVYRADCESFGHLFDFQEVVSGSELPNPNDPRGMPLPSLRSRCGTRLPHILCQRCGSVWLVIDEPGDDYDDTVARVTNRLDRQETEQALTPWPVPGTEETPIPLAPGVVFDELPETHPAKMRLHELEREAEHARKQEELARLVAKTGPLASIQHHHESEEQ